ncbi:SpoIIE family protein phosphatase [Streptomyces violens]|uniref:SpoIIE family protein phosphatase n=1 Tax=Streptomyces violens TaxID=66377 RepID=UPI0009988282
MWPPPSLSITRRSLDPLTPRRPSPPLGLGPGPCVQRHRLLPDQRLLLYSDGLTEARDAHGTLFPLDSHARAALMAPTLDQALDVLLALHHQHPRHAAAAADDLTLVLAQLASAARAAQPSATSSLGGA